jgi:hypothetical protein
MTNTLQNSSLFKLLWQFILPTRLPIEDTNKNVGVARSYMRKRSLRATGELQGIETKWVKQAIRKADPRQSGFCLV